MPTDIANIPAPNGFYRSTLGLYLKKAQDLAGFGDDYHHYFEDFNSGGGGGITRPGWSASAAGTGDKSNNNVVAGRGGGLLNVKTGATAASLWEGYAAAAWINNISTSRWYFAARWRINTTPDAQTKLLVGLYNRGTDKSIACGVVGSSSTTLLQLQYDGNEAGSFQSFGVNVDANLHVFEMWGAGSAVVNARIDGAAPVQVTQASAPTDHCYGFVTARNGTTAADQNLDIDWMLCAAERT